MLDISITGAFAAGLLSFASPCVLPLVPPYLCFLAGVSIAELAGSNESTATAAIRSRQIFIAALAFVLGFTTVFVALGATASAIGTWVTAYFDRLAIVAGAVILVVGLHFLGWLKLPFLYREMRFRTVARPQGVLGAYLVGLAFAFGWTPCVGPILATVLMVAGAEATAGRGAVLLSAYALGIGVPFLLAAAFAGPFLDFVSRFRRHMGAVEKAMGAALVVTGLLFMSGSMASISDWLLQSLPFLATIG